ncbi:MAG TPA: ABC transporter ATP-binding protein [Candidatus Saccharibacteria bacterium]|nr:ABC transporter ATP-binding protein [Candidatus Saccharibacteria bacterium]HRQ98140.1 ABC transporter ATP-binding protein [Candidatus Saccharibacteria bacterium]
MIEVKRVTKTYGKKDNKFVALNDISFVVPDGASVAIIGKSGSGKSTLMHAMSGLDRPELGEVVIDGRNILALKQKEVDRFRSATMSFIFQSFFVQANESCYDNVSLPLEIAGVPVQSRHEKIEDALRAVELLDKKKSRARDLSGGQKQRLAVARAIVNNPKIIFADEPTGNLDSVTGEVVEDLLFSYNKRNGITLIIVTHDPDLASKCDIKIYIKDGKIESIKNKSESQQIRTKAPIKSVKLKRQAKVQL